MTVVNRFVDFRTDEHNAVVWEPSSGRFLFKIECDSYDELYLRLASKGFNIEGRPHEETSILYGRVIRYRLNPRYETS